MRLKRRGAGVADYTGQNQMNGVEGHRVFARYYNTPGPVVAEEEVVEVASEATCRAVLELLQSDEDVLTIAYGGGASDIRIDYTFKRTDNDGEMAGSR